MTRQLHSTVNGLERTIFGLLKIVSVCCEAVRVELITTFRADIQRESFLPTPAITRSPLTVQGNRVTGASRRPLGRPKGSNRLWVGTRQRLPPGSSGRLRTARSPESRGRLRLRRVRCHCAAALGSSLGLTGRKADWFCLPESWQG